MGKQWKQYTETLFSWAPKSLRMVTAAMKLKDACSLEEKLWPISAQFSSVAQSCLTLWDPMDHSTPGVPVHHQLPEFSLPILMSIVLVVPSNHLIPCCPLLLLPSIFPSIRVFWNESAPRIRWPKYWSFSFNISPSNEHSGLISFRMDWLDLPDVQGTLKSLV